MKSKTVLSFAPLILITTLSVYWWFVIVISTTSDKVFSVHFLDVGQGDAIFLETPGGHQVLVDGGRGGKVVSELDSIMPSYDKEIDVVIATHADADHIGGLNAVFDRYFVRYFIDALPEADTRTYTTFQKKVVKEGSSHTRVNSPMRFYFDGVRFSILFPSEVQKNRNDASIILLAEYGGAEVLLTGDASKSVEISLVEKWGDLIANIDVLKAGHHGSKTSSSDLFLELVNPKFVVISAGEGNSHGHPHEEVITAIKRQGSEIYETKDGTVTFTSLGEDFVLKTK